MQRVNRLKFIILATIACAVLFCIAAFSVSLAKWTLGDNSNATKVVQGNASNFYIEYPQYVEGEVEVPSLESDKYYLQVPQRGNTGTSDFYEFQTNTDNTDEVKLKSVYLHRNDILSVYNGNGSNSFKEIKSYSGLNLTLGENVQLGSGFVDVDNKKLKVETEGFYDFYYVKSSGHCFVNYAGIPSASGGNTTSDTPERDTNKNSVKVSFANNVSIVFQLDGAINPTTTTTYFYISGNSGQCKTPMPGLAMNKEANNSTNTVTLDCTYGQVEEIILTDGNGFDNGGKQTGTGNKFYSAVFNSTLVANCVYTINVKDNTWWDNFSNDDQSYASYFTVTTSGSGSGGGSSVPNPADSRTAITTDIHGTTDFHTGVTLNSKKTIRKVSGAQGAYNKYVYKNYICVSRPNSAETDDDNSIAYLEFEVSDSTVNPYDVKVTSLKLKRRATDANGNIKDSFVDPAPRIYNYDTNLDTRLGQDTSAADKTNPNNAGNENRLPIFALGIQHTSYESAGFMKPHYDDGVYVVLYFGDNDQQYFALDIEIELEIAAGVTVPAGGFDFTLTAKAANSNSWERYADGYGEPWGFYMGGLINSVEVWDPSRTTKLERATDRYVTQYDASREANYISNPATATNEQIGEFNNRTDFNYKIIKFFKASGDLEGYARYPKGKIDVSLTVNLTEGSLIKMYMLDHDGDRKGGNTVWIVPSEIKYDKATEELFHDIKYDIYDRELNTIIPITGTYVFRLVGYFHTRDEEVEDSYGNILKGDQICFEDGKRYEKGKVPSGYNSMGIPNFNLWVDTLYITCSSAGDSNSECTIKLDANGGAFNAADLKDGDTTTLITRIVTFGSDIRNLPKPKLDGKEPVGWFYEDEAGNTYDFDFGSAVTGNMTLKAKWKKQYSVTFDANGGTLPTLPNGITNPIQTDEYGNLIKAQWDAFKPTYNGYKFLGWYTAAEGGTRLGSDTTFTANRTVYAHWEQLTDGVFINGAFAAALSRKDDNEQQALTVKITVDSAVVTVLYNGNDCSEPKTASAFNAAYTAGVGVTLGRGEYDFYYKHQGGDEGLWIVGRLEIVFNANGGKFTDNTTSKTATTGEVANKDSSPKGYLSSGIPANPINADTHYEFDGWNTKADGSGTKYTSVTSSTGFSAGMTLYAQWKKVAFDISFDLNGATGTAPASITTNTSGKLTSLPSEPTWPGYRFDGWYTDQTNGSKVTTTSNNTFTTDTKLWAHWVQQFTVTFKANTGASWSDGTTEQSHKVDINETVPDENATNIPTNAPTGYEFDCWSTATGFSGGSAYNFTIGITADVTLYAQWKEVTVQTYTITFNANSGTLSGSSSLTTDANGTLSGQTTPTATRDYYNFLGWNTSSSATAALDLSTHKFTSDTPLYAVWKAQTITFKFTGIENWNPSATVYMYAWGSTAYLTKEEIGTSTQAEKEITLDPAKGMIIGVKFEFVQGTNTWTAYSFDQLYDYEPNETYTFKYTDWSSYKGNIVWSGSGAWKEIPFEVTVKNSKNQTIDTYNFSIDIFFGTNQKAALWFKKNNDAKGIHLWNKTTNNAFTTNGPEDLMAKTVGSYTVGANNKFGFLLTQYASGNWTDQGSQSEDRIATYSTTATTSVNTLSVGSATVTYMARHCTISTS